MLNVSPVLLNPHKMILILTQQIMTVIGCPELTSEDFPHKEKQRNPEAFFHPLLGDYVDLRFREVSRQA